MFLLVGGGAVAGIFKVLLTPGYENSCRFNTSEELDQRQALLLKLGNTSISFLVEANWMQSG